MRDIFTAAAVAIIICVAALFALPGKARSQDADLCLVLMMDFSGSVTFAEGQDQLNATADALTAPSILQRIFNGPVGRVAIMAAAFGESFRPIGAGWYIVSGPQDMARLAHDIRHHQRYGRMENTHLGNALYDAGEALRTGPDCLRRTVDVSGDGEDNCTKTNLEEFSAKVVCIDPVMAAAHVTAQGALVNSLVIQDDNRELTVKAYTEITSGFMREASWPNYASGILSKIEAEVSLWPAEEPGIFSYEPLVPVPSDRDRRMTWYVAEARRAFERDATVNEVAGLLLLLPSVLCLGAAAVFRV